MPIYKQSAIGRRMTAVCLACHLGST